MRRQPLLHHHQPQFIIQQHSATSCQLQPGMLVWPPTCQTGGVDAGILACWATACWPERGWWQIPASRVLHMWYRGRPTWLQQLPLTCWVAPLQEHINQFDDLESSKALVRLSACRQPWEAAPTFNMRVQQAHYSTISQSCTFLHFISVHLWRRSKWTFYCIQPVSLCY